MENMKAVVYRRYGGVEVLEVDHVPRPAPGSGQVLLKVRAAGLDRGTWHLMTGRPYLIRLFGFGFTRPKQPVLGMDVAGRVVAIGEGVNRLRVGDEVFGIGAGTFAEFAVADEKRLSIRPAGVSAIHAAVSAISGTTALQALTDVGRLEDGQRVLIIGASGGVGSFAVQLARALGAGSIDGVAGTDNIEFVRSLGADRAIDYRTEDVTRVGGTYDLILDIAGRSPVPLLRKLLSPSGTIAFVGGEGGDAFTGGLGRQILASMQSMFVRHRMQMFVAEEHHRHADRLAEFLAAGTVVPAIGRRVGLDGVKGAMADLAAGRGRGKTVVVVESNAEGT